MEEESSGSASGVKSAGQVVAEEAAKRQNYSARKCCKLSFTGSLYDGDRRLTNLEKIKCKVPKTYT